ncbi:MAG: hypothetical protein RIK87_01845 [Fuerstiella sp.]
MISGTQTLFNWSLRTDIRSVYPHVVRMIFCGFMFLAIFAAWADSLGSMAPGLNYFRRICMLNVLLISVAGISYFVSAVTEEKDAGTLALLRLAGVSPLAIVLSKSTSRLISALMLLLIQLPFTFLAITLGGVTWQQVIAAYLSLAAWMCMVANMALFCSVRCQTSGRAASLATAVLLLFFASGPILLGVAGLTGVSWISPRFIAACRGLYDEQQLMSVTTRLEAVLSGAAGPQIVAEQFWRNMVVGLGLFVLSVLMFNRYSEPVESNPHGRSSRVRRFTVGRCWRLAIVWKDFLFFTGGKTFLTVKLFGYALLIAGFVWFHRLERPGSTVWLSRELTRTAFEIVTLLLTVEMLLYSSNSLFQEVRQSAIATLRMLPIHTPVILLQKLGASLVALSPAMLTLVCLLIYDLDAVLDTNDFAGQVVAWVFISLLSTHLTVLLSLYTRWAALPLAILLTAVSFPCIGAAAVGLTNVTRVAAELNGIRWGAWAGVLVNFVWMWIFVLLPVQVEIVNRWNRLSQE